MSIAAIYFLVAGKAGLIISRRAYSRTGKTWNASFSYLPVFNKSSHSCRFSLPDSIFFFFDVASSTRAINSPEAGQRRDIHD